MENLLTTKEVSVLFGVSVQTVRAWVRHGRIRCLRGNGGTGHIRFDRAQLSADLVVPVSGSKASKVAAEIAVPLPVKAVAVTPESTEETDEGHIGEV